MVFPGYKNGSVQVSCDWWIILASDWSIHVSTDLLLVQMMDLFSSEQRVSSAPVVINAHRNELVCLATNQGGSMVSCDWWRAVLTSDW